VETIDDQKWLARRIALARDMRGLRQTQIAELLGIAQSTYSEWETGKATIPALTLFALARVTQVPVSFFFPPEAHHTLAESLLERYPDMAPATLREIESFAAWAMYRDRQIRTAGSDQTGEASGDSIAGSSAEQEPSTSP
jgi:transcriptional regulator with XRE-family HTH domain